MKDIYKILGIAAVTLLVAVTARANMMSQDFVTKASVANMFEIQSSQLALDKAQSQKVKDFAQRLIDDHTKIGDQMENVLESSDMEAADSMDSEHQKLMTRLRAASGDRFDDQFLAIQENAHKKAVSLFSDYAKSGNDPALKNFAAEVLPMLKDHLMRVRDLKAKE